MSKSKAKARPVDSDESDSDSGPDDRNPPPSKKAKPASANANANANANSKPAGKSSSTSADGDEMFQLARMRYATVREFKGRVMVDIREHYEDKTGDLKPGKKGISLSMEQWNALKGHIEDIDQAIKKY